jgi:hypothetical protein
VSDDKESEIDDFVRGFHGIPRDEDLRSMSYVALVSMLSSSEPGTPKYMVIEREKRRRDLPPAEQSTKHPGEKPTPENWYKKPIGLIGIAVTSGLVLAALVYLFRTHLGIL